jgi:hypothetical protein
MPPFPDPYDPNEASTFPLKFLEWKRAVEERRPPPPPIRPDDEFLVRIGAFIDEVRAAPAAMRETVAATLQDDASGSLASYAKSASALAVRTGDSAYLDRAVVALGFA